MADLKQMAIRSAIKMIGEENIKNMLSEFIADQWSEAKQIPLEPGEKEIAAFIYKSKNKTVFATVAYKVNPELNVEVTRYIKTFPVEDIALSLIEKIV